MGDPKKQRKKYETPFHPWQRARIDEEKILTNEYGLTNKKEIWKINSLLRSFKRQAKKLIASHDEQAQKERKQLIERLARLNLIKKDSTLDEILGLDIRNLMERRLQTLVYRKKLSRSVKQARQFITHGQIMVSEKKISSPSYIVKLDEEGSIGFALNSPLKNPEHPERFKEEKVKDIKTQLEIKPKEEKVEVKEIKEPEVIEVKEEKKELESYDNHVKKKEITSEKILKEIEKESKDAKGPKDSKVPEARDLVKK